VVTFYNRGQEYRRVAVSAEGDRCDWFAVVPRIARDGFRSFDPAVDERPAYLAQRELFDAIGPGETDGLEVEERVVGLPEAVLRLSYRRAPVRVGGARDAVAQVEKVLSERWDQALRTLHQDRTALRVRCVLESVRGGRLVDIVLAAGLSSHSHFTSAFREAFGMTPGLVRQTAAEHQQRCRAARQ
jgi:AraC-like DNA-binding protein